MERTEKNVQDNSRNEPVYVSDPELRRTDWEDGHSVIHLRCASLDSPH